MDIKVISLFPEALESALIKGILKRALSEKKYSIEWIQLRDFALDKHQKVDDEPFGHTHGMLLKVDVLYNAITSIHNYQNYHLIYPCPKGKKFDHTLARDLSEKKGLIFIIGYYEGVDERIFELLPIQRLSMGDFVLMSGELPALTMIEAILRFIPGVLGNKASIYDESIMSGALEAPRYTHPREFMGKEVPEVLRSGNHKAIADWEKAQSDALTQTLRPDLLKNLPS